MLRIEDANDGLLEKPYRIGIEQAVNLNLFETGTWEDIDNGRIFRLTVYCADAQAIGFNFSGMFLAQGADLFIYQADGFRIAGSFSGEQIPASGEFTVRPLAGDRITIEYFEPQYVTSQPQVILNSIAYIYRGFEVSDEALQPKSGNCEVNVNCEEGTQWQDEKNGVVKILTKVGSKYFYCTGTLVNTTSQDFSPLLLSASHCSTDFQGGISSAADYGKWIFYFKYESSGCTSTAADELTMVGADLLASSYSTSEIGSDFLLLQFPDAIPATYNPYYCGWDARDNTSSSGACIHHPDGDIKKISTYSSALQSATWSSVAGTHWKVSWAATPNGHGVTEGGSSGSPLFSNDGLILGALTGGESSCSNVSGSDFYGKLSYSWISNGITPDKQLKPWLDQANTGQLVVPGSYNDRFAKAEFNAKNTIIPVGGSADFQDLSSGMPDSWHWYFQGAEPLESTEQNPQGVVFNRYGLMNVKLVVRNAFSADSLVKEGYIDVRAVISPNPSPGYINILTGSDILQDMTIEVFDVHGKKVQLFEYSQPLSNSYSINLPEYGTMFFVKITRGNRIQTQKVIKVNTD